MSRTVRLTHWIASAVLLAACGGEGPDRNRVTPAPSAEVSRSNETFRRTAATVLRDAAEKAGVAVRVDGFVAASADAGSALVAAAAVDGAERLTTRDLAQGAEILLTFLPATLDPDLPPGPYLVRVRREIGSGRWSARFADLDGNTVGEVPASVDEKDGEASGSCRVFLGRSGRKITEGLDCGAYTVSFSTGEDLRSPAPRSSSPLGRRMTSANDTFRRSVRSALCAEARAWKIPECPKTLIAGSRGDSLAVSGSLADDSPIPLDRLKSGFDSLFTYLDLPASLGVPRGFYVLNRSQDAAGTWISRVRDRAGKVVAEPTLSVTRSPRGAPSGGSSGRYVSYLDSTWVCLDHDVEVIDVETGHSVIETDISCFAARVGGPTTPPVTGTPGPTRTRPPTPAPIGGRTTPPATGASPTPAPTRTPSTPEPTALT